MKKIWFVRHGESLANIGVPTNNHKTIPLSPLGIKQAEKFSKSFYEKPTLIVTSSFLRTQLTAEPTMKRFPKTRYEVWDVEEFTHLNHSKYINTGTIKQWFYRYNYWKRLDPDYRDGEGAESFNDLLQRTRVVVDRLKRLDDGFIIIFTHAQFMRAVHALLDYDCEDTKRLMAQFREIPQLENCGVLHWEENNYYFDINETYLEDNLPVYIQHDIDALVEGRKNNSSVLDCLYCELQGSVNAAENDCVITGKQAQYLRKKYL